MEDKEHAAVIKAVEYFKSCPFKATGIKVELEANMNRDGDFYNTELCHDWMMTKLEELGLATKDDGVELSHGIYTAWSPVAPLKYAEFYNDGSVDSEFTFTLSLESPETVFLIPKIMDIFKGLAEANGNGMDVSGAGMHTALINNRDCRYDTTIRSSPGQNDRFNNFSRSMSLLLPALFFLSSPGKTSRALRFRTPKIATGNSDKYTAINYRYGALEFRCFETCYDKPEQILDNIVVISNCMKFWKKTFKPSGLEKIVTRVKFGNDSNYDLERFYKSVEHIDLLNAGLEKLKPSYLTITQCKRQRSFDVSREKLADMDEEIKEEAKASYAEYEERWHWETKIMKGRIVLDHMDSMVRQAGSLTSMTAETKAEIERKAEEQAEDYVKRSYKKVAQDRFVDDHLSRTKSNNQGRYTLTA